MWRLMIKSDKTDFNILFFKVQQIKDLGFSFLFALTFILITLYTVQAVVSIDFLHKYTPRIRSMFCLFYTKGVLNCVKI